MCISFWKADFSNTITGTWEVMVDGQLQHVLWYQNKVGGNSISQIAHMIIDSALSQIDEGVKFDESFFPKNVKHQMEFGWLKESDYVNAINFRLKSLGRYDEVKALPLSADHANCLVIPLRGTWESIRLLNTTSTPSLLRNIHDAVKKPVEAVPIAETAGRYGGGGHGIYFLKFDIYDIIVAQNAQDLPSALSQITEGKRPKINDDVFDALQDWYQCPIAVCCFNTLQTGESSPLAFTFQPLDPGNLLVYTLDAHDGKPPNVGRTVHLDHTIFVGSYLTDKEKCATIKFSDKNMAADLRPYVLDHAMGMTVSDYMQNGDFIFDTEAVRRGQFEGLRMAPPHAPAGLPRRVDKIARSPLTQPY